MVDIKPKKSLIKLKFMKKNELKNIENIIHWGGGIITIMLFLYKKSY